MPQRLLARALAIDPDYIQALAVLSGTYDAQANITTGLTRQQALALMAKSDQSSARALAANPSLWIGHAARGWYYVNRQDLQSAERSYRRMAELDSGNEPGLRSALAGYALLMGRSSEALALYDSGELIDPIGRFDGGRVTALSCLGRYREAIDLAQKIAAGDQRILRNLSGGVFWSYLALGQEAEAIRFSEQYFPAWADALRASRANKALLTMSPAELRQWADRRYGAAGPALVSNEALFAAYNGHPQLAVELMRVASEMPVGGANGLWNPMMAEARKTDEFERLVTDIGLVRVWRETGDWGDYCRPVSATEITCH